MRDDPARAEASEVSYLSAQKSPDVLDTPQLPFLSSPLFLTRIPERPVLKTPGASRILASGGATAAPLPKLGNVNDMTANVLTCPGACSAQYGAGVKGDLHVASSASFASPRISYRLTLASALTFHPLGRF